MSEARLAAWRDRRRDPLTFQLATWDPDTDRFTPRTFEVPEHPARTWVLAWISDDPADVLLDVLDEEDAADLWEEVRDPDSDIDIDLLRTIGKALLGKVTGRPWWSAGRLIVTLVADWETFDGIAADRGLGDPLDWPVERLCNWVYLRLIRDQEDAERARIDAALEIPPADANDEELQLGDDEDTGEEAAAWFAAMSMLGGSAAENGVARG